MEFLDSLTYIIFLYCKLFIHVIKTYFNPKKKRRARKVIDTYGDTYYYNSKNQHHRKNGPAVITRYYNLWYKNGIIHREDGPAVEWHHGSKEFYLDGKQYSEREYLRRITKLGKILYG